MVYYTTTYSTHTHTHYTYSHREFMTFNETNKRKNNNRILSPFLDSQNEIKFYEHFFSIGYAVYVAVPYAQWNG